MVKYGDTAEIVNLWRLNLPTPNGHSPWLPATVLVESLLGSHSVELWMTAAVEARTLQAMLKGLQAPAQAMVVMDRGIATEENLAWLRAHGYRSVVVSRERGCQFDARQAVEITAAGGERIGLQKISGPEAQEVRLYCHSPGREQKERAIVARLTQRFEQGLAKIAQALKTPRGEKGLTR